MPVAGADWTRIRPDGAGAINVRMCMKTDDDIFIYGHWQGLFVVEKKHLAYALDFEKPDDLIGASRYYFRTTPRFEAADQRYGWLNRLITVSKSRTGDGGVFHDVFAIG